MSRRFELDCIELGYPGAVSIAVENCGNRWGREGWVVQMARYAEGPSRQPAWMGDGNRRYNRGRWWS